MREAGILRGSIEVFQWMGGGECNVLSTHLTDDEQARGWLVGMVAGFVAEDHWRSLRGMLGASRSAAGHDFAVFASEAGDLITEAEACRTAHGLLLAHWDELETLVPGLAEAGRMNGADL